jgi:hypothetical protein
MPNPQSPLDPCSCWGVTMVTFSIMHCPSLNRVVREELDKVIRFAAEGTRLSTLGKVRFNEIEEAHRSPHEVPGMPFKADA